MICCTGAAVSGDTVAFSKTRWKPLYQPNEPGYQTPHLPCGRDVIAGKIVHETKGGDRQQVFTIKQQDGGIVRVTSRTMYRFGVYRERWADEALRTAVLFEKYEDRRAVRHGAVKLLFKETNHGKDTSANFGENPAGLQAHEGSTSH